jgi:hypothetical protein
LQDCIITHLIPRFISGGRTRYNSFVRFTTDIEFGTGATSKKTLLLACLPGDYTQFSSLINSGHLIQIKGTYQVHLVLSRDETSYEVIKNEPKEEVARRVKEEVRKEVKEEVKKEKVKLEARKKLKVALIEETDIEVCSYDLLEVK